MYDKSVHQKWLSKVVKAKELNTGQLGFPEVVKFIEHLSLLASEPSYSPLAYKNDACKTGTKRFGIRQQTEPNHPHDLSTTRYFLCDGIHKLEQCKDFQEMYHHERRDYLYLNKLCFNCFENTSLQHTAQTCKAAVICKICQGKHHTLMHEEQFDKNFRCNVIQNDKREIISMCVVPIKIAHKSNPSLGVDTYALLDDN